MPRPVKLRKVHDCPLAEYYKPRGIPLTQLEEVHLTMDEFEAIRLADYEGLYQENGARNMNISRQTFGNIIEAGHRKIADALLHGKAIRIEGGCVEGLFKKMICPDCHRSWQATKAEKNYYRKCYGCRRKMTNTGLMKESGWDV